jgi:lipopolysaccharide/colanic/teichoic acid biosynthesis glycosyltransferase
LEKYVISAHPQTRAETRAQPGLVRVSTISKPVAPSPHRHWYLPYKAAVDRILAFLMLLITSPILLISALLVKLTSPGPAFYSQVRVGRGGRLFNVYKVRSMAHECEKLTGPRWSLPDDPRVTPVGRFLRRTHLDELPQLWNVILGHMSLIGPRPERPEFLPALTSRIPHYSERLAVRPGITGLAQVQLAADTDMESVRRKLANDLYYIRQMSPWLDCKILICTAFKVLHVPMEFTRRLFRWPHVEPKERAHVGLVAKA